MAYVAAAVIVVFGALVVRRLVRSWRDTYRDGPRETGPGADAGSE
ncbi:hypothetical protein BH18ACT17_BH18ACT17_00700 [soil metagenome]